MNIENKSQYKELKKTSIGGQALIEGLMMIGPEKKAMANLMPDGRIVLHDLGPNDSKNSMNIPFLRGAVRIFKQMSLGTKALMMSADLQEEAETAASEAEATNVVEPIAENVAIAEPQTEPAEEALLISEDAESALSADTGSDPVSHVEDLPDAVAIEEVKLNDTVHDSKVEAVTELSAVETPEMQAQTSSLTTEPKAKTKDKGLDWVMMFALILGLGMGIGLFFLLPNLLTSGIIALTGVARQGFANTLLYNLLEGVIRIVILLFYMWLSSKQKDIKRVWMFHGAEHKTIACYEAGRELTVDNIKPFSRFHPRCGTSFIFIMVFISAIIFAVVGWYGVFLNLLIRLALIPLVAGIAYEILRFSGKHSESLLGRILAKPGLLLQRLTTKEPDEKMLEVAIRAMNAVIPEDQSADNWA